jgi:hypothetical protein
LLETLETQREDESVLDYLFFIRDSLFALFSPSFIASVILAASTVDRSWKKKLKSGHIKVFDTISASASTVCLSSRGDVTDGPRTLMVRYIQRSSIVFAEKLAAQWLVDYSAGLEWADLIVVDAWLSQ